MQTAVRDGIDRRLGWQFAIPLFLLCFAIYYLLFARYFISGQVVFGSDTHGIWTVPYLMFYSLKQWGELPWWDPTGLNGWPIYSMLLDWSYSYLNPYSAPFIASYYLVTRFTDVAPDTINTIIVIQKTIYYFSINFFAILLIAREVVRNRIAAIFIAITFTLSAIQFEGLRDSHQFEILPGALFYIFALLRFDRRRDLTSLAVLALLAGFYLAGASYAVSSSALYWTVALTVFMLVFRPGLFRSILALIASAWRMRRGKLLVVSSMVYLPLTLAPPVITLMSHFGLLLRITGTRPINYDMGVFGDWTFPYGIGAYPIWTNFLYWAPFYDLHQKILTVTTWLSNGINHRYVGLATLPLIVVALILAYRHRLVLVFFLTFFTVIVFLLYGVQNQAFLALLELRFFQNTRTISSFIPRDGGVLMLIFLAGIGLDYLMLAPAQRSKSDFAVPRSLDEERWQHIAMIVAFGVLAVCAVVSTALVLVPALAALRHTFAHIGIYLGLFVLLCFLLVIASDPIAKRNVGIALLILITSDLTISASDYFIRSPGYMLYRNETVWTKPTPARIGPISSSAQLWTGSYGNGSIHNTPISPPYRFPFLGQREWLVLATRPAKANLIESWDIATARMRAYPFFRFFTNGRYIPFDAIRTIDKVEAPPTPGAFFYLHDKEAVTNHANPGEPIAANLHIDNFTLNRVQVTVTLPKSGFMVYYDNYNPYFRARVDGHDVPILRANFTYKAIAVSAGHHQIEWIYDPWPVKLAWVAVYVIIFGYSGFLFWFVRANQLVLRTTPELAKSSATAKTSSRFAHLARYLPSYALIAIVLAVAGYEMATKAYFKLPPATQITGTRVCPIALAPALAKAVGASQQENTWEFYSFGGTRNGAIQPPPDVDVSTARLDIDGRQKQVCVLSLAHVPEIPRKGADWRIGHVIASVNGLHGDTVTFRLRVRGSEQFTLSQGYVYIYDGNSVVGVPMNRITEEWKELVVHQRLSEKATRLEFWVRLLFDSGTIQPRKGNIYLDAAADIDGTGR